MRTLRLRSLVSILTLCVSLSLFLAERADAGLGRWTPVGPGGGTVFGLAADPGSPNALWAATSVGIYKSVDRGETWSSKTAGAFSAVAADPDHPSIVYAAGRGVVRSEDGGETWRQVLGPERFGKSVAVAPGSGTVYVAADDLRRSTDGGRTWKTVLDSWVDQVVIDPATPRTVYAVRASIAYQGLWKSVDAGDTWAQIGGTPVATDVRALALAPSRPGTLYAATGSGLYRSTDGGGTWTARVHPPLLSVATLVVDPDSPSTVYSGGFHGIAVSNDGGASWTRQDSGLPGQEIVQIQTLAFSSGTPRFLYTGMWDYGVARKRARESHWRLGLQIGLSAGGRLVEIDPVRPGTFYVATAPGRTFRTTDGGHTWMPFATALTNSLIEDITVDPFHPGTVYAGMSDGLYRSLDDGATWERIDTDGSRAIALTDRGNVILSASCGLSRSGDGGLTWQEVIPCTVWEELTAQVVELVAIPGRPAVHALVYASDGGSTQGTNLYSSYSHGARWREGIAAGDFAVSPFHPATVYTVGSYPRGNYRSDDGGRHWKELDTGGEAYSVAVDPRNPEIVYVSGRNVRRSTDGGRTWSDAGAGLELLGLNLGIVELFADPTTPGHFFGQLNPGGLFEATFPSP